MEMDETPAEVGDAYANMAKSIVDTMKNNPEYGIEDLTAELIKDPDDEGAKKTIDSFLDKIPAIAPYGDREKDMLREAMIEVMKTLTFDEETASRAQDFDWNNPVGLKKLASQFYGLPSDIAGEAQTAARFVLEPGVRGLRSLWQGGSPGSFSEPLQSPVMQDIFYNRPSYGRDWWKEQLGVSDGLIGKGR